MNWSRIGMLIVAPLLVTVGAALTGVSASASRGDGPAEPHRWPENMRGVNIILRWITESDLDHLANDWKANSVRLMAGAPLSLDPPHTIDTGRLERIYEVVNWCRERGLYVVINLGQPDGQRNARRFWETPGLQTRFTELWATIAHRYADRGRGIAYDLMNEPHGEGSADLWPGLARRTVAAVRELDQVHPIVIEPSGWGNAEAFVDLKPFTNDANTVYSFHFYHPFDFTHQRGKAGTLQATPEDHPLGLRYPGTIKAFWETAPVEEWNKATIRARIEPVLRFRETYGKPVWCGEFGCTRWADGAYQYLCDCLDTWEDSGIGWCYYSYREWYAMDLEKGTQDRSRDAPRFESDLVTLFKRYFARAPEPGTQEGGRRE